MKSWIVKKILLYRTETKAREKGRDLAKASAPS